MDLRCEDDCVSKGVRTEEVGKFAVDGLGLLSRQPRPGLGAKGEEVRDLHRRIKGQQTHHPMSSFFMVQCAVRRLCPLGHTHTQAHCMFFFLSSDNYEQ